MGQKLKNIEYLSRNMQTELQGHKNGKLRGQKISPIKTKNSFRFLKKLLN